MEFVFLVWLCVQKPWLLVYMAVLLGTSLLTNRALDHDDDYEAATHFILSILATSLSMYGLAGDGQIWWYWFIFVANFMTVVGLQFLIVYIQDRDL